MDVRRGYFGKARLTIWELPPGAGASAATSVVSGSSAGVGEVGSSPSDCNAVAEC